MPVLISYGLLPRMALGHGNMALMQTVRARSGQRTAMIDNRSVPALRLAFGGKQVVSLWVRYDHEAA